MRGQIGESVKEPHAREDLQRRGVRRVERERAVVQQPLCVREEVGQPGQVGPHRIRGRAATVGFGRPGVADERPGLVRMASPGSGTPAPRAAQRRTSR